MTSPPIPVGWRVVGQKETILEGDRFWDFYLREWNDCESSIGGTPESEFSESGPVIRAGPPTPPPEKEWVDPWD